MNSACLFADVEPVEQAPAVLVERSNRAEVRNPVLGLPEARAALAGLDRQQRAALRLVLIAIRDKAREQAETDWKRHKAPMAAYWKAAGVYCNHIARACGKLNAGNGTTEGN